MSAATQAVFARAKALGISLSLGTAADGSSLILWRGPKGSMTPGLKADMVANKSDLVGQLMGERRAEIRAAFAAAHARIGKTYPSADDAGLPEVARQLPDLFGWVERLESGAETAATAYQAGFGSLEGFVSALAAWEHGALDAVTGLANFRSGKTCADCGSEAPVTVVTSLGQRFCSTCVRADAAAAHQVGSMRRRKP